MPPPHPPFPFAPQLEWQRWQTILTVIGCLIVVVGLPQAEGVTSGRGKQTAFSSAPLISPKITGISHKCSHQLLALVAGIIIRRSGDTPSHNNNATLVQTPVIRTYEQPSHPLLQLFPTGKKAGDGSSALWPKNLWISSVHSVLEKWRIIRNATFMQNWMGCNAARFHLIRNGILPDIMPDKMLHLTVSLKVCRIQNNWKSLIVWGAEIT